MSTSVWEINFNYQKAMQQASDLLDVARKLKKAADQDMDGVLNEVNRVWQSDHSREYLGKGRKVREDLISVSRQVEKIAVAIRTIADRVRSTELEAWRIANERKN